jgi:hypothetical protein
MDRRLLIGGGVVLVLIVAGGCAVKFGGAPKPQVPEWLRSHQPAEGAAAQAVDPVDPKASWAACRPSAMVASCTGQGAGRRTMRTYPSTLADCPHSLVSGSIRVAVDI